MNANTAAAKPKTVARLESEQLQTARQMMETARAAISHTLELHELEDLEGETLLRRWAEFLFADAATMQAQIKTLRKQRKTQSMDVKSNRREVALDRCSHSVERAWVTAFHTMVSNAPVPSSEARSYATDQLVSLVGGLSDRMVAKPPAKRCRKRSRPEEDESEPEEE